MPAPAEAAQEPARPHRAVLEAPVPVALPPPAHPDGGRVVVAGPGLVAAAHLEPSAARVRLRILVQEDGTVGRVEVAVSSGRADLDSAAAGAAQTWRFRPARRDGVPIDSQVLIWVVFRSEP